MVSAIPQNMRPVFSFSIKGPCFYVSTVPQVATGGQAHSPCCSECLIRSHNYLWWSLKYTYALPNKFKHARGEKMTGAKTTSQDHLFSIPTPGKVGIRLPRASYPMHPSLLFHADVCHCLTQNLQPVTSQGLHHSSCLQW